MKLEKPITRKDLIIIVILFWAMVMGGSVLLNGQSIREIYLEGLKAGQQKDIEGAESYFIKALAVDLFYIPAQRAMDVVKDLKNGLVKVETAAVLFDGMEYYEMSKFKAAIDEYAKAVKEAPGYYLAYHNLGSAYYEDGQNAKAIAKFQEALKLNPRYPYTHNNLGLAYVRANQPYQAIEHYKKALEIDPSYYKVYNNLGVALSQVEKEDEARVMFRKALEVNPKYSLANINVLNDYSEDDEAERNEDDDTVRALSVEALVDKIEKGDWRERKSAARALALCGGSALHAVLTLLEHPTPLVRATAAIIIGDMKAWAAVDSLILYLEKEGDWTVRCKIVDALGEIKDYRVLETLHRSLLEDPDYHVRIDAAHALSSLGDPSSVVPLDKALRDPIPEVRQTVLSVLADTFDPTGYYRRLLEKQNKNPLPDDN